MNQRTLNIDFVIAWVDGADPAHRQARERYRSESNHRGAASERRFHESGEIYYLIASILKYAPFIRRVYIITDNQRPKRLDSFAEAGLCDASFLQVVSHDVIFDGLNVARPTFNARVIEAAMWRIPGLSEHFVYSNDDMFLNAPVAVEDFFRDGRPVLRGHMMKPDDRLLKTRIRKFLHQFSDKKDVRPRYRLAQEKGAKLAGVEGDFLHVHHHPHPLRRSPLGEFYKEHPEILNKQMSYRFRDASQHHPVSLSNHLEMTLYGATVEAARPIAYMQPDSTIPPDRVLKAIRNASTPFGCIQNLDIFPPSLQQEVHRVLREKFRDALPSKEIIFIG